MRILFCSQLPITRKLGAVKVLIELAEALRDIGVECVLQGREEILQGMPAEQFPAALRSFLIKNAEDFDVADYDHEYLPYPRADFSSRTLMVARSVLLIFFSELIRMPRPRGLKPFVHSKLYGRRDQRVLEERVARASNTISNADLVNVSNAHDKIELQRRGVPESRIVVLPYGISSSRRPAFDRIPLGIPEGPPVVAFVGTFDYRKGATEIPKIWNTVRQAVPDARLRLLGTKGLMQTERDVRAYFSRRDNESIEVFPTFEPDALPSLLADCWVGIFPSRLEGFGFGVLEMLAAGIPVVAYDAPGPPEMLGPDDLVSPGNWEAMALRVLYWLTHRDALQQARTAARNRSLDFDWTWIAKKTANTYAEAIDARRVSIS